MIENGSCDYQSKCMYAHSIDEQNIEPIRKLANEIVESNQDLSDYDRIKDKELYKTFLDMSRICENCVNNKCTGGKNCKHGIKDKTKLICETNLKFGNCSDLDCKKTHLSNRGLKSMYVIHRREHHTENHFERYRVDKSNYKDKLYIDSEQDGISVSGSFLRSPFIGKLLNDNYINLLATLDKVNKISYNDENENNDENDDDNLSVKSNISNNECDLSIFTDEIDDRINKIEI
jgi:hypothetical protein